VSIGPAPSTKESGTVVTTPGSAATAEVQPGGDVEGLLGPAEELTRGEDRQLVALVAVGVEGEAPALLVAEVAQPAEMGRRVAQPLLHLLARLAPAGRGPVLAERLRLGVGVDVAELAAEADLEPGVAAGEVRLGIAAEAR